MANIKFKANAGIVIFSNLHDLPCKVRNFGEKPQSSTYTTIGNDQVPVNLIGGAMYPAWEEEIEYVVIADAATSQGYKEIAKTVINLISLSGEIERYDMPDGAVFYVSYKK